VSPGTGQMVWKRENLVPMQELNTDDILAVQSTAHCYDIQKETAIILMTN
jgi:hypothetical protein